MAPRLLVGREHWTGNTVTLPESELYHARRVLRLTTGDEVIVFDGEGREALARIEVIRRKGALLRLMTPIEERELASLKIILGQGLPKARKIEAILEDGTELGLSRLIPIAAFRSIVRLSSERVDGRVKRWQRIAQEAAKQCGRPDIPRIDGPMGLSDFLKAFKEAEEAIGLICWEEATAEQTLTAALAGDAPNSLWILIGPEGGWSKDEAEEAIAAGFRVANLGPRILRTETAGPAILAIAQHVWGDLS